MSKLILEAKAISKHHQDGLHSLSILDQFNLSLHQGEMLAICGASGCGKSTLLHILGGLEAPSSGEVWLNGEVFSTKSSNERAKMRHASLGFIYQFHHLIKELTALENVMLPLMLSSMSVKEAKSRSMALLEQVGLAHRVHHVPAKLSGGERQRVAIARSLITKPACLLADEPTGNLDQATAQQILDLLLELNRELGTALVLVTHDQILAKRMGRLISLI